MGLVIKTAATWISDNTVLSDGDLGVESDTGHYKLGDGATEWNSKAYYGLYSYSQLQLILLQNGIELQNAGSGSLFLAADGTYKSVSGGVSDGDKGDITVSSGGTVWTIDNDAVTNSKINSVSATKVTEDSTHRFTTDSEKSTWNAKASGTHTHIIADVTGLQAVLDGKQASGTYLTSSNISDTVYGVGWNGDTTNAPSKNAVYDKFETKQDTLVSTTNIKTINGASILGSGDLTVSGADATKLAILNNLSDLNNASTARTNLGVNTTVNISSSTNKNFVTDAQLTVIGNTSNTNTGDNAVNTRYSGIAGIYRNILQAAGSHIAARVAGTYFIPLADALGVSGTGTLYAPAIIRIDSADYPTIDSLAPKFRIKWSLMVNDVAPTGNFTVGLYPITRPATSGGAGLNIYTMGTVVSGSNGSTFTTPSADSMNTGTSADFALPADGYYVLGVVTTATVAVSSHLHINAQLQVHNA